jgi:hypothetical protein
MFAQVTVDGRNRRRHSNDPDQHAGRLAAAR